MNPNNELLQAAKAIEACPRLVRAEYIGPLTAVVPCITYQVPSHLMDALRTAIARAEASASQPAAVPSEREKAIALWREGAMEHQREHPDDAGQVTRRLIYCVTRDEIDEAIALMRSAPLPAPAVPYSCPACGAEMDSSRCWCCGWSNK